VQNSSWLSKIGGAEPTPPEGIILDKPSGQVDIVQSSAYSGEQMFSSPFYRTKSSAENSLQHSSVCIKNFPPFFEATSNWFKILSRVSSLRLLILALHSRTIWSFLMLSSPQRALTIAISARFTSSYFVFWGFLHRVVFQDISEKTSVIFSNWKVAEFQGVSNIIL
jgi:hypothetical protein